MFQIVEKSHPENVVDCFISAVVLPVPHWLVFCTESCVFQKLFEQVLSFLLRNPSLFVPVPVMFPLAAKCYKCLYFFLP